MYKRWRVYSTFLTGLCIGLAYALLISHPMSPPAETKVGWIEWPVLVLAFSGILGGVIYSIVVNGRIEMPRYIANRGALFKAGLFGDILLGIAGAFLLELLLQTEMSGAAGEEVNGAAIAATGIIGGYGGRAIIKFSLARIFKVAGGLAQVRTEYLEGGRSQAEENESGTGTGTGTGTSASDPAILLIEQLDDYIQTGLPKNDWIRLTQQLQNAPKSVRQEVFAALADLQPTNLQSSQASIEDGSVNKVVHQVANKTVEKTVEISAAQRRRMIPIFEAFISLDPNDHQAYHQLALTYGAVSPPDYKQALSALDQAIARRGPLTIGQPWQYELDRAVINIRADIQANLQQSQLSQPVGQAAVVNSSLSLAAPRQADILADLLTIAQVYNLETILKAAEAQQIPLPVVSWLRRYQLLLETNAETRSLMASLRPVLLELATVSTPLPSAPERTIPDNPQGILFPQIYAALGKCYDLLHLDPFDLMGSAKATRVFSFYSGEAIATQDEGNRLWIPENTRFIPGSRGSLQESIQTSLLYTEADVQKLFAGTLGGSFGGTISRLIGAVLPFSFSASYATFKQMRKTERSVLAFTKAEYVHYALALDWAAAANLHLNEAFQQAVAQLPLTAASYAYLNFIDSFGTHVSTHVKFGGLVHHHLRLNQSTYAAAVQRGANVAFEAQKLFQSKYANDSKGSTYREISDSSQSIDFCGGIAKENIHDWFDTIKDDPAPIHIDLLPLCDLLNATFFPRDRQIAQKRSLLAAAIQTYLEKNSLPLTWELWPSVAVGGDGGSFFSDIDLAPNRQAANQAHYQQAQVAEVRVWIKNWVERVQLVLETEQAPEQDTGILPLPAPLPAGSEDGELKILRLDPGDYITAVEVSAASPQKIVIERGPYVGALRLHTHQGKVWTVGTPGSNAIALDIPEDYQVIGFHGRVGKYIDKLGVISMPVHSREWERKLS